MIWSTVISQSCFCWLYRASLSVAAKNIINLILVLTIWWCPCVESSLVLLEEGVCYDQCVSVPQSCLTLCDPKDYSLPGSSAHVIFQARVLEWVAIVDLNAAAAAKSLQSCPTLCDPIDGNPPGSPSLGFSRQEHWSGCRPAWGHLNHKPDAAWG